MNHISTIDESQNIFLTKLFEPEENVLEFELTIGTVNDLEDDFIVNDNNLGPAKRIEHYSESDRYSIRFNSYIGYSVIDESYEQLGGTEYSGEKIRIYTDSNFLNYLKAETIATADYPGPFKHYAFITLNHIVNVASEHAPKIEKLN
jgi:hypothetical protein